MKGFDNLELVFILVTCHLVGDYVLQNDFIAKTKGENWYHLFVHAMLYCTPFLFAFGFDSRLIVILVTHFIVDSLKARFGKIDYIQDQIFHYIIMTIYLI